MANRNYSFVIDSSFKPFTMQEMLVPLTMYKDAFEKTEETYLDLVDKSDSFKYLSQTLPEGSKARQLYEGYANDLDKQAEDLARNGLSMGNRRALTSLKRRYQGEIGRLSKADEALQKEKELRRQMYGKDSSILFANDNINIDDFLDGGTPNTYSISGDALYKRGAAAGAAASSRIISAGDGGSTLGGYYRDWVERHGYSKESIDEFRRNIDSIPELRQAIDDIMIETGAVDNLTGSNYARARQSVINGIVDNAAYQESHKPIKDEGVMSASERDSSARGWASINLQKENRDFERAISGYVKDGNGNWEYNEENDQAVKKAKAIAAAKGANTNSVRSKARKPKSDIVINKSTGGTDTYKNISERGILGEPVQITKEEALKSPYVFNYVGKNADLYDYFDNGTYIVIKGHPDESQSDDSNPNASEQEDKRKQQEEENQL